MTETNGTVRRSWKLAAVVYAELRKEAQAEKRDVNAQLAKILEDRYAKELAK